MEGKEAFVVMRKRWHEKVSLFERRRDGDKGLLPWDE
jgi:hypothetical protein